MPIPAGFLLKTEKANPYGKSSPSIATFMFNRPIGGIGDVFSL